MEILKDTTTKVVEHRKAVPSVIVVNTKENNGVITMEFDTEGRLVYLEIGEEFGQYQATYEYKDDGTVEFNQSWD